MSPNSSPKPQPEPENKWTAIFSPGHNAYYFYNTETEVTTWTNPLQPSTEPDPQLEQPVTDSPAEPKPRPSESASTSTSSYTALQDAALAAGIDPSLAHLDPSLLPTTVAPAHFTAKFNARTGTFTRTDAREPGHLSEYERAKRMSEVYFDVGAWERDVEQRKIAEAAEGEEGRKRKRPTKKDLERFKEQKKQKKIAKTAWLRQ